MNNLEIFTLNARDNCLLDLLHRNIDYGEINQELSRIFLELKEILKRKDIEYSKLKYGLIPSREKQEVLLVFDREKIDSSGYGQTVFDFLFPILDYDSVNSFMCGDYIDIINNQDLLKKMLFDELNVKEYREYKTSHQFYFVYINNVNQTIFNKLKTELSKFSPFVGLIDVSYGSLFKDYLSFILCNSFIKSGKYILKSHPDDVDNSVDEGFYFERFGYITRSLQCIYYDLFLSYKIECKQNNSDTHFSICALTPDVLNVKNMFIKVSDSKLGYLNNDKDGIMKRLGLIGVSTNDLEQNIKNRIKNNYLFNLRICNEDNSYLFNTILEFEINNKKYKLLVALKYIFSKKQLFLVTMY